MGMVFSESSPAKDLARSALGFIWTNEQLAEEMGGIVFDP